MKIYIDGDGAPVKNDVIRIAKDFDLPVVIVTSFDHYTTKEYPPYVKFVYVDKGQDAADYKIVELIRKNDVLITQDYGLASLVLGKKARVLHQSGLEYTNENIGSMLEQRYQSAVLRKAGIRPKGTGSFADEERDNFRRKLRKVLEESLRSFS